MALYGKAGSGKSTLASGAASAPMGAPVLFLDAEGGSRAVAHRPDINVIDVASWKEIDDFTEVAKKNKDALPWKTIVFDNMSEYLSLLVFSITGNSEDAPTQPEWGKVTLEFLTFVRTWRDISRYGVNVIFIAWEDEEKDSIGRVKHNLHFTPKIRKEFPGMVDIIGYIEAVDRSPTQERVVDFSTSSKTVSKFRRSQDEAALAIPFQVRYGLNVEPMADIINVLKEGKAWPTAKYTVKTPTK